MITAKCRKCGNEDLASYDTIIATTPIGGWRRLGDNYVPEFSGGMDVCWDTSQTYNKAKPYYCDGVGGCGELLSPNDIEFIEGRDINAE